MPGTATVTGTVGPGRAVTAGVLSNVTWFAIDTTSEVLDVKYTDAGAGPIQRSINIGAAATITCTVSGNTYTLTIS